MNNKDNNEIMEMLAMNKKISQKKNRRISFRNVQFINTIERTQQIPKPKEVQTIEYEQEYDKMLINEYDRKLESDDLMFSNQAVIDKPRAVVGYSIKYTEMNLIKGKSIMNVCQLIFLTHDLY